MQNALVLQATHLGTQQFAITPNDKSIPPVNMTLSIEEPKSLGASINSARLHREFPDGLDSTLYALADDTGIPPQMIKGQVKTEGRGFDPLNWRYEPVNASIGDFGYSTKAKDLRMDSRHGSSLRLPAIGDSADPGNCGTNYDYKSHIDGRIPDTSCRGLPIGSTFSPQVMSDIAQTNFTIDIPNRDPKTGLVLTDGNGQPRPLRASDRYVSVYDVFTYNDGVYHWSDPSNAKGAAAQARVKLLKSGSVDFTAQLSLAASYGLLQVMYARAIDEGWAGSTPGCGATNPKDPDNLFDTSCNLDHGGGSLGLGTRITDGNFANYAGSTNPTVNGESDLESLFDQAYQEYNRNKDGYGDHVIANTKLYEPNPTGSIFNAGGQQ
jgi:hypothetical protein